MRGVMAGSAITKWEYKSLAIEVSGITGPNWKGATQELAKDLKELGAQGWELVSVLPLAHQLTSDILDMPYTTSGHCSRNSNYRIHWIGERRLGLVIEGELLNLMPPAQQHSIVPF
jgi:hypothetical protein